MSSIGGKVAPKFRETFRVVRKDALQWFPGHMDKGLKQMQQRLKDVDCVIEVHDARIPISGRFLEFKHTVSGLKPHIFVLNKVDLAETKYSNLIKKRLAQDGVDKVIFTNFKNQGCPGSKKIFSLATTLIENSNRYNRTNVKDYAMMIIGAPNVGKSSLINRLRSNNLGKPKATQVGAIAGITRSVLNRIKISEDPPVYLLDTPGILTPNVTDVEAGLKLALVGCLQDHLVGEEVIADYLLFWLNKHENFDYVDKLGLPEPSDNIIEVLTIAASKLGKSRRIRNYDGQIVIKPDFTRAAEHFLRLFRSGELGRACLDADVLKSSNF